MFFHQKVGVCGKKHLAVTRADPVRLGYGRSAKTALGRGGPWDPFLTSLLNSSRSGIVFSEDTIAQYSTTLAGLSTKKRPFLYPFRPQALTCEHVRPS